MRPTVYGRQPAQEKLRRAGLSTYDIARLYPVKRLHVYQSVSGMVRPSEQLREILVEVLKEPVEELFTEEALKPVGTPVGNYSNLL